MEIFNNNAPFRLAYNLRHKAKVELILPHRFS